MFIPVMIAIMVSHGTARAFNRSLYEYSIRGKQMPLLRNHVPKVNRNIRVREIIDSRQLETVPSVCTVSRLAEALNSERGYSTLAIVNMYGCLIGLIPKSFAIVLIKNQMWYETMKTQDGRTISVAYGGPHQSYFTQNDGKGMNLTTNRGNYSGIVYDNPDLILRSQNRQSANFPN